MHGERNGRPLLSIILQCYCEQVAQSNKRTLFLPCLILFCKCGEWPRLLCLRLISDILSYMLLHMQVHWSQWSSHLMEVSKILCERFSGSGPIWIHHVMKVQKDRRIGKEKIRWSDPAITFEMAKRQHEAFPIFYSLHSVFKTVDNL